jgi:hypothetical protein
MRPCVWAEKTLGADRAAARRGKIIEQIGLRPE